MGMHFLISAYSSYSQYCVYYDKGESRGRRYTVYVITFLALWNRWKFGVKQNSELNHVCTIVQAHPTFESS